MSDTIIPGTLYICGTPIGNLEDISIRAVKILGEVDFIACEDTRQTIKLINHFNLSTKLLSYHEHNEIKRADELINILSEGKNIALVSDAGMPLISDPGNILIKKAIEHRIKIIPVSGPSAFLLTLVASGFNLEKFIYNGFFSKEKKKRKKEIESLIKESRTSVFYESPHRIIETLEIINELLNDRNICIGREITKKFEEFVRGRASEIIEYFKLNNPRGEFCLAVEGCLLLEEELASEDLINEKITELTLLGLSKKEISKKISSELNISSKEIYSRLINKDN